MLAKAGSRKYEQSGIMAFDFTPLVPAGLAAAGASSGPAPAKFNFTGGNNDPDEVPVEDLMAAAQAALTREGRTCRNTACTSGPQGYKPLREFLAAKLKRDAGIDCTLRRYPDRLGLAAGARSGQRRAAGARRHRDLRARLL